jgi:hypothetical protein
MDKMMMERHNATNPGDEIDLFKESAEEIYLKETGFVKVNDGPNVLDSDDDEDDDDDDFDFDGDSQTKGTKMSKGTKKSGGGGVGSASNSVNGSMTSSPQSKYSMPPKPTAAPVSQSETSSVTFKGTQNDGDDDDERTIIVDKHTAIGKKTQSKWRLAERNEMGLGFVDPGITMAMPLSHITSNHLKHELSTE